jgi:hypothetical protein
LLAGELLAQAPERALTSWTDASDGYVESCGYVLVCGPRIGGQQPKQRLVARAQIGEGTPQRLVAFGDQEVFSGLSVA